MEQILIVVIIALLGVLVVNILGNIITNVKDITTKLPEPCKLHDWAIDDTNDRNHMYCMSCGYIIKNDN